MFRKYGKPILAILALCLLCAGCQLAKPELGETQAAPVGIWLEAHAQPPAQDYVPAVDYDAPGALGLVMLTERVDEEGNPYYSYGSTLTHQFLDVHYGSHTNLIDDQVTQDTSSFSGTLYLDDSGDAPEDFYLWYVYGDRAGGYYAKGDPIYIHISHQQLSDLQGGTLRKTFSYETTATDLDGAQVAGGHSYSIVFAAIGNLEKVEVLAFDQDFQLLARKALTVQDGDAYPLPQGTALALVLETYQGAEGERQVSTAYTPSDALDYDGQQALYHCCKYMGPAGIVEPRGLKLIFP
ncbi:MAG: hypothetical protein ACLUGG_10975 [Oscillospiraceae bacterium]